MDQPSMIQYITGSLEGVETVTHQDNVFFFYRDERMMPFTTLMTNDENDTFSNLNRPSVYRLNIGVSKATFLSLFGERPPLPGDDGSVESSDDFTAFDQLMPHPVYGRQYWVCIVNPSDATFESAVRPLLDEAHGMAVRKHERRAARR